MDLLRSIERYTFTHISKIRGFSLMKCSIEMLQNLPYIWLKYKNQQTSFYHFSLRAALVFLQMNSLVNVDIDQAIGYHIPKVWQIMKHFAATYYQAYDSYF